MLALLAACAACGSGSGDLFPQSWSLAPSADAIEQVESIGWDAQTFYELVAAHTRDLCSGCDIDVQLGDGDGEVRIAGARTQAGILGEAASGTGVASVNQAEVFRTILGPAPEYPALEYTTIDEAASLLAVIVAHEVGHALSLPHNRYSTIMNATPTLLTTALHEFTPEEIERMRAATGQVDAAPSAP